MSSIDVVSDLKRKTIGKIVLVFFGIMILLTFFSNTINNYTLPKISVNNPTEGSLLKKITGNGIINAKDIMDVYIDSNENCKVQEVKVEVGNWVKKGDELVVIKNVMGTDTEKQKKIDELTYEKMTLIYKGMMNDYNAGVNQKSLKAGIDASLKNYEQAERRLKNVKELYDYGAETLENYKSMETVYELAKEEYETKLEGYDTARNKELANIKQYEIDMKLQEEKMKQENDISSIIYAPLDGVVKEVWISNGTWVNKTTKLISITNNDSAFQFNVDLDIDSADLIKQGDKVTIEVTALGRELLSGEVISVGESKNFKGVKKEVIARIYDDIPGGTDKLINKISGGERGEICIEKPSLNFKFVISNMAIIPGISEDQGYVWVVREKNGFLGKENYIEVKDVTILDSDDTQTAIDGGITAEDEIVIKTDKPLKDQGRVLVERQTDEESNNE